MVGTKINVRGLDCDTPLNLERGSAAQRNVCRVRRGAGVRPVVHDGAAEAHGVVFGCVRATAPVLCALFLFQCVCPDACTKMCMAEETHQFVSDREKAWPPETADPRSAGVMRWLRA